MAKNKFKNHAAVMRNKTESQVVITQWKNIPLLRHRRRTSRNFSGCRIKRVPIDAGISYLLTNKENYLLNNYPNLGFYKFFDEEIKKIKDYYGTITDSNYTVTEMKQHLPVWFVDLVIRLIPRSLNDRNFWHSYLKFSESFDNCTGGSFREQTDVRKFFYARFEKSLAGTLEPDVISFVPVPRNIPLGNLDDYVSNIASLRNTSAYFGQMIDSFNDYRATTRGYTV